MGAAAKRREDIKFSHHSFQFSSMEELKQIDAALLREAIDAQDVDAVRRLLATPSYQFPATRSAVFCLVAAQSVGDVDQTALGRPAVVRAILRDGRADLTLQSVDYPASTALVYALDSLRFSGCSTTKFLPQTASSRVARRPELGPPPLPPPRRRALPQVPRVLLVPGPVETGTQRGGLRPRPSGR